MSEFTARANIKNKAQLRTSSDKVQKATLRTLASKERRLLAEQHLTFLWTRGICV